MNFATSLQKRINRKITKNRVKTGCSLYEIDGADFAILFYLNGASRASPSQIAPSSSEKHIIHIDYDLWHSKPSIILNRLTTLVGKGERSYARECVVARIDKRMSIEFQEEHHLQGALPGKYRYGLFKDGELLAIAAFSGLRNMRHTENYRSIELLHYCQKGKHVVIGGLSKLISNMFLDLSPNDVMTYIDRDWSTGDSFRKVGFVEKGQTEPQLFEIDKKTYDRTFIKKAPKKLNDHSYLIENSGSIKMVMLKP